MKPQDAVAIVLAFTVMFFVINSTLLRPLLVGTDPELINPEVVQGWKDIINVIIGALAGFIAGRTKE